MADENDPRTGFETYRVLACACPLEGTPHVLGDCKVIPPDQDGAP